MKKTTTAITQGVQTDTTMTLVMTTPTISTPHVVPTIGHIHHGTPTTVTLKSETNHCDILYIDTRLQFTTLIALHNLLFIMTLNVLCWNVLGIMSSLSFPHVGCASC